MSESIDANNYLAPVPDAGSAAFFDGLAKGVLRIQRCADCGAAQVGQLSCDHCASINLSWTAASGWGTVYSFVVFHTQYHPAYAPPYIAGIVELEEGPCLYTLLAASNIEIGTRVRIDFRPVSDEMPAGFIFVRDGA
jgi:uncharacterized OB-fold protein